MAAHHLTQLFSIDTGEVDIFCARFSPPGRGLAEPQLLALGLGNGSVAIHHGGTGRLMQTIAPATASGTVTSVVAPSSGGLPITCIRWRPEAAGAFKVSDATTASRNVLLAAGSDGTLRHIHATSGRVLNTIVEPAETQIYACDYRRDGMFFASAGNARAIRIYDEERRTLTATLTGGSSLAYTTVYNDHYAAALASPTKPSHQELLATGHNNRIFSVIWHPTESHMLASGGWDNTIQIWDTRVGHAVRSIFGPHLAGDGLTFSPNGKHLITGSWRANEQLQVRKMNLKKAKTTRVAKKK
jgi:COMPASS component SWD3